MATPQYTRTPARTVLSAAVMAARPVPPTAELFPRSALVQRHPHLLSDARVQWALRNRHRNGLAPAIYESRGGQLVIHEPTFLSWFLGLDGRRKPRRARQ